ncbi:MAG: TetR/AcrR family transcriptional regulator [Deltaproteobacteria bacterium]|nr:TetR/AcrR family transcriptional regulator [Deltaproteobacteria bacterium]
MTRSQSRRSARPYHHGDLRAACLAHGRALLASAGLEAVTLREIARRAGVSPRAPYRHFAQRDALLAAIAEDGFADFGAALARARDRAGDDHGDRLRALARAYLGFAAAHPALLALMFGDAIALRARRFPALARAAFATFAILRDEVAAVSAARDRAGQARHAAIAWALVHGLAELGRTGQLAQVLGASGARGLDAAAARVLTAGLGAPAPAGAVSAPKRRRPQRFR